MRIELSELERQAVLMALAELSLAMKWAGWDELLNAIALRLDTPRQGRASLYDGFRELRALQRQEYPHGKT